MPNRSTDDDTNPLFNLDEPDANDFDDDAEPPTPDNELAEFETKRPGSEPLLIGGPRWYRIQIRRFGPVAALVPMAVFGLVSWGTLKVSDSSASGVVGLGTGSIAAPGLLAVGAPFGDSGLYPLAVVASIPLWLLIGWLAARRATQRSIVTWREYSIELLWLSAAVIVGAIAALAIASARLGEPLLA